MMDSIYNTKGRQSATLLFAVDQMDVHVDVHLLCAHSIYLTGLRPRG